MSRKVEFATRLGVLAEVLGEALTPIRVAGYWEALSDLESTDVFAAMDNALKTSKFFPRPAELREHAEATAEARRARARLAHPVVPHYRRLETGDTPVDSDRIRRWLAEERQRIKTMAPPEDRRNRRRVL